MRLTNAMRKALILFGQGRTLRKCPKTAPLPTYYAFMEPRQQVNAKTAEGLRDRGLIRWICVHHCDVTGFEFYNAELTDAGRAALKEISESAKDSP